MDTVPRGEHSPLKGAAEKMKDSDRPVFRRSTDAKDPRQAVQQRAAELREHDQERGNIAISATENTDHHFYGGKK
jgi:hypothetical protein